MLTEDTPKQLAQIALVVLLIAGCVAVLLPFIGAVLFAFVVWACTWESYDRHLRPRLGRRDTLGASLMTLTLVILTLLPMVFLATSLASSADALIDVLRPYIERGLPADPPALLGRVPFLADDLAALWRQYAGDSDELAQALKPALVPLRQFVIALGAIAGNGLLQLALTLFVLFFLYRDGEALGSALATGAERLGGQLGSEMLDKARGTVLGVMLGLVGTAAAQATAAMLGFLIAGVPGAILLGFATFFLSMVPIGPPLVWGGAAAWLYTRDQLGWTVFMVLYGLFIISSIDNFLKPLLMSRGARVSVLLIALGVLGGVLVFGFIGIFLGPVLLALGQMLASRWTKKELPA